MSHRILLIDDSKSVHAFVGESLKAWSLEYVSVFNGQEALALLRVDCRFDLLCLDWEMPLLTGPETLLEIRRLYPQLRVMMMTSKGEFADIQMMLERGAVDYMIKPFTKDILAEKISSILGAVSVRSA